MRLSLVCVLFDPAIPTSFFNFIQLFLYLYNKVVVAAYNVMGSRLIFMDFLFPLASTDQNKAASGSTTSGTLNLGQLQQSILKTRHALINNFCTQMPCRPLQNWVYCELPRERRSRSSRELLHSGKALVISLTLTGVVRNWQLSRLTILPARLAAVPCSSTGSVEMD